MSQVRYAKQNLVIIVPISSEFDGLADHDKEVLWAQLTKCFHSRNIREYVLLYWREPGTGDFRYYGLDQATQMYVNDPKSPSLFAGLFYKTIECDDIVWAWQFTI